VTVTHEESEVRLDRNIVNINGKPNHSPNAKPKVWEVLKKVTRRSCPLN